MTNSCTPAAQSQARHDSAGRTRAEIRDWLATQFTHITPDEMRAAELAFLPSAPVAGAMAAPGTPAGAR